MTQMMTNLSSTLFASADFQVKPGNVLFNASSLVATSQTITIEGAAYVFAAFGMTVADVCEIDMVVRTPIGDIYEPLRAQNGVILQLTQGRNIIPLPVEGRYRARMTAGTPGDFTLVAYPTKVDDNYWSSIYGSNTVSITSTDGGLNVTSAISSQGQVFTLTVVPTVVAGLIAASPASMAVLAAAIGADPTLHTVIADLVTNAVDLNLLGPAITPSVLTTLLTTPADVTAIGNAATPQVYGNLTTNPVYQTGLGNAVTQQVLTNLVTVPADTSTLGTAVTPQVLTTIIATPADLSTLATAIGGTGLLTSNNIQNLSTIDPGGGPGTGTLTQALNKVAFNFTRLGV